MNFFYFRSCGTSLGLAFSGLPRPNIEGDEVMVLDLKVGQRRGPCQ